MEHTCTHKPSTRCIHEALTASGSWIWQLKKKLGGGRGLQKHQVRTGRQASKALLGSVAWTDKWKGEPAKWRTTGLSEDGYRLHLDRRSTNGPHTSSTTGAMANMCTPDRHIHRCAPPWCTHTKPRVYTKHRPVYTHASPCVYTQPRPRCTRNGRHAYTHTQNCVPKAYARRGQLDVVDTPMANAYTPGQRAAYTKCARGVYTQHFAYTHASPCVYADFHSCEYAPPQFNG